MARAKTTWVRHCILLSQDARSVAIGDFLFFADGSFGLSTKWSYPRGSAIALKTDLFRIRRAEGSDIISIKTLAGERMWFEYQHGVCDHWWQVLPNQRPLPGEEPTPLARKREWAIQLKRILIAIAFGLTNDSAPRF